MGDDPAYLPVGTAVSAKYKGAFCEAKVSKVVRVVKCKITYKGTGLGTATVTDDAVRGPLRVGHTVQARHADRKEFVEATISKIQDCSQYTVVFDDGDITTLRRTALCLKSGRHFNESETLDQLPLTHPEHWGFPVGGGGRGRGRRSRHGEESLGGGGDDAGTSGDGPASPSAPDRSGEQQELLAELYSGDIGKVVCVEAGDKKKRDSWFPGLVVVPSAQPTVRINVRDEFLVRSFKDGRYYTVPRKEILEFSRDVGRGADRDAADAEAMERALRYLDRDELPAHWERGPLFDLQLADSDSDAAASDTSDDEPREEKDHFVAQLYKFMDDRGTPLNKNPTIANRDIDLYRLFRVVQKLGGYNRVTNQNKWRSVAIRLGYAHNPATYNSVKQAYKRFLLNFEDFYRKLGCTMINHPRSARKKGGRSLIRDRDRATPSSPRPEPEPVVSTVTNKISAADAGDGPATSGSEADGGGTSGGTPKSPRDGRRSKTSSIRPASTRPTGEKVRALVEKFEEQAAAVADDEPPAAPARPQHTRSKSVGPQTSRTATNTASGRNTPAPGRSRAQPQPVVSADIVVEVKQRGRKRKDTTDQQQQQLQQQQQQPQPTVVTETPREVPIIATPPPIAARIASPVSSPAAPPVVAGPQYVSAAVGDKLKVYYGPTHESKVTYEAKVLEVEPSPGAGGVIYFVHYTGWNIRYDEWIKPQRIAENLSAQNKAAKQRARLQSASSPTAAGRIGGKRGRARAVTPTTTALSRRQQQQQQHTPRRTRRTSAVSSAATSDTDDERQEEDAQSDSEPDQPPPQPLGAKTRGGGARQRAAAAARRRDERDVDDRDTDRDEEDTKQQQPAAAKRPRRPAKRAASLAATAAAAALIDSDEDSSRSPAPSAKGRDFDLNQIRSELKGFEKAVKVAPAPEDGDTGPEDSSKSPPSPAPASPTVVPDERLPPTELDIYEFKEPEPFEFETSSRKPPSSIAANAIGSVAEPDKQQKQKRNSSSRPLYEGTSPPPPPTVPVHTPDKTPPKKRGGGSDAEPSPPRRRTPNTYKRAAKKSPAAIARPCTPSSPVTVQTPAKQSPPAVLVAVDDDPFDKLAESPSFNNVSGGSSDRARDETMGGGEPALSLFCELPEPSTTGAGPPRRDDEPDDSGGSDLGPEPPPFQHKEHLAAVLDPIFRGFTQQQQHPQVSGTGTTASDEDDPIGAAIQRAMTHTMTDEDSSGDDLFMRRPPSTVPITTAPPSVESHVISPALQETDPRLLDAISQQTAQLLRQEEPTPVREAVVVARVSPPPPPTTKASGAKIADSILHKFNLIKRKEEDGDEDAEEDRVVEQVQVQVVSGGKRRATRRPAVSREFVESDSDSSTDSSASSSSSSGSERRLVIAPEQEQEPELDTAEQDTVTASEAATDVSPLLLCEETIPGSPAPAQRPDTPGHAGPRDAQDQRDTQLITSVAAGSERSKPRSAKSLLLEMPFASAPAPQQHHRPEQEQPVPVPEQQQPLALPLRSPDASPPPPPPADIQSNAAPLGRKRRRSHRAVDEQAPPPTHLHSAPVPAKRGRRPLAASGQHRTPPAAPHSDDEQPLSVAVSTAAPTGHRHPRYNFLVELDPTMDAAARISLLQQRLSDLRHTYNQVKSELAAIDRRRKKLRRRDRDQRSIHHMHVAAAT